MADTARGKVSRIYPHEDLTYIRLEEIALNVTPRDGYFRLDKSHPNYAALYSLVLVAAVNRYPIMVRTTADISNLAYGEIRDILLDYQGIYGTLDTAFGGVISGGSGIILTDISGGKDHGRAMVAHPLGSVIVAGTVGDSYTDFGLARYQWHGGFDVGFGSGGTISHSRSLANLWAQDIALQDDGKIVVVGTTQIADLADLTVSRFLRWGELDSSFDQGWVDIRFGNLPSHGSSVALQPDGKMVVAGSATDQNAMYETDYLGLVRLNSDGSFDPTFGVADGQVVTPIYQGQGYSIATVGTVALQADGRILVAGSFAVSGAWRILLMRFTSGGQLDTSFGTSGRVETLIGSDAQASDMAIQRNVRSGGKTVDKIVVAGHTGSGTSQDFVLVRYNLDGSLDNSFGSGGIVITDFDGREDRAHALAVAEDNSIIVVGVSQSGNSSELALARYQANGAPDSAFGTDGKVRTSLQSGVGRAEDVVIQPVYYSTPFPLRPIWIVVTGWASNGNDDDFLLTRYHAGLSVTRGQWIEPVLGIMMG